MGNISKYIGNFIFIGYVWYAQVHYGKNLSALPSIAQKGGTNHKCGLWWIELLEPWLVVCTSGKCVE
jgi:hypothetical protein